MRDKIKALRKRAGMNQAEFGVILGIGQKGVSMIESGINQPTVAQIKALADYFSISTDYLFGYDSIKPDERKILNMIRDNHISFEMIMNAAKAKNGMSSMA